MDSRSKIHIFSLVPYRIRSFFLDVAKYGTQLIRHRAGTIQIYAGRNVAVCVDIKGLMGMLPALWDRFRPGEGCIEISSGSFYPAPYAI